MPLETSEFSKFIICIAYVYFKICVLLCDADRETKFPFTVKWVDLRLEGQNYNVTGYWLSKIISNGWTTYHGFYSQDNDQKRKGHLMN